MQIVINGETREADTGTTVAGLLDQLKLVGQKLAVEKNGDIVPHSAYEREQLQDGDRLEVLGAIGGG